MSDWPSGLVSGQAGGCNVVNVLINKKQISECVIKCETFG